MDSAIDLYFFPASPPTRAVMLMAKFLGVALNLKMVNIMAGEQMKPEFLKINPTHTVPVLDDNGYILWESKAIAQYIIDRYDRDNKLSAKDPKQMGIINQLQYFDGTTLFPRVVQYFYPIMGGAEPNNESRTKVEEALSIFDGLLRDNEWAAGNRMSAADFSLVATVSTAEAVEFDINQFPNITAWYNRVKKTLANYGYEEINQKGADMIGDAVKAKLHH